MRTQAQNRATAKWEEKAYDKVLLRMPKGTKAAIQAVSESVNGYIVRAVLAALAADGVQVAAPTVDEDPAEDPAED